MWTTELRSRNRQRGHNGQREEDGLGVAGSGERGGSGSGSFGFGVTGSGSHGFGVRSCLLPPTATTSRMPRPLRLQFPDAVHPVTSHGDRRVPGALRDDPGGSPGRTTLHELPAQSGTREQALHLACAQHDHTITERAGEVKVSVPRASRIVAACEGQVEAIDKT